MVDLAFSPTISVSGKTSVGQVLQSAAYVPGIAVQGETCPIDAVVVVNGSAVPGQTNVFMTNLPGLGVRYSVTAGWRGTFATAPYSLTFRGQGGAEYYIMVELVVTGPIGNGVLTTIPSLNFTFSGTCFDTVAQTQYVTPGSVITGSTCFVTTSAIQVSLVSSVPVSSLASNGATSGNTPFSIGLNCPAPVDAYISFADVSDPGNRSTILSATADSTAKGVGVQISSGWKPLSLGPASAEKGDMTAWSVGRMNAGANLIPLVASYARTGPVTSGTVRALATFIMSYR